MSSAARVQGRALLCPGERWTGRNAKLETCRVVRDAVKKNFLAALSEAQEPDAHHVAVEQVEALLKRSVAAHPTAFMHLFAASFQQHFRTNSHLEMTHLAAAEVGCRVY